MSSQRFISISQADVTISRQLISENQMIIDWQSISYYVIEKTKLVINTKGFFPMLLKTNILVISFLTSSLQNQPYADVIQNICSLKFCKIYRRTHVSESIFQKVNLKRDSDAGFVQWILRSLLEHLFSINHFWETPRANSTHHRCYIKKLFLKISRYSQENSCFGICF